MREAAEALAQVGPRSAPSSRTGDTLTRSSNLICGRRHRRRSRSSVLKETPVKSNVSRREARATSASSFKSFAIRVFFFPFHCFLSVSAISTKHGKERRRRLYGACQERHKREDLILSRHNFKAEIFILFSPPFGGVYLTGCQVSRTSLDIDLKDLKVCDIIMRLDLIICCPAAHRQVWARN